MTEIGDQFPIPKETRPWVCKKESLSCTRTAPCNSCRGARSRRSGLRKQREARKVIEKVTGTQAGKYSTQTGNEETWRLAVRFEAKSGAQVGPIATRFLAAEEQAGAAKATGDGRPFAMLAMPTGWGSDGLFLCRLTDLGAVVRALGPEDV